MLPSRRFLPSISLLAAFEAVARTGSVTTAARELDLTQSAVSRQIKALEEQLGAELFLRERQTVRLTLAGDSYAREVREALRRISSASLNLRANPHGGTLNLAILPTFGTRWLAPRLSRFLSQNPGVTINLVTRLSSFDFRLDSIDAAIHFGHPQWPGAELTFLMSEKTVPACSPEFFKQHGIAKAEDLLNVPLLHLTTRTDAWEKWFAANGVAFQNVHGMLFDQFATAAQAAIAGLGVALLPTFLIQDELRRGDLVAAIDREMESSERYYLAYPPERADYAPLSAFRGWIIAEAEAG
ncbi:LysR substrate-binding domain-containing protein [Rhizobium sullae]|uniref:HTH-type transcriptional regulator TtuA n=1 Tax=Rhizobium sullae TaxID=50338 RepID=A0A2N0CZ11_RHISU|nr:LysR substrate-binding domain-containing protein [Rhizobium sullae]PKA39081.1 LysR family transcriptional regulator [Rhizobium sullae]UWU13842.1 LysR substrate-binding domain-containing protein [Rhizobium sullae]